MKTLIKLSVFFGLLLLPTSLISSELTQEFKNPSFSGQGYSNHVLSVDQLERQRKQKIKEVSDIIPTRISAVHRHVWTIESKESSMSLCAWQDIGGTAGEGMHALLVPGTISPAFDISATLLAAWALSWISQVDLSTTIMLLLSIGMFMHKLFCVPMQKSM